MNRPKHLYYIAPIDNLKSILKNGILSHSRAYTWWDRNIVKKKTIYDPDIIQRRKDRKDEELKGKSLLDYANVYFQARNPMLYRVIKEHGAKNIVVLEINANIINIPEVGITDGNAASSGTQFFDDVDKGLKNLDKKLFDKGYWIGLEDGKRKIMAEVLIPDCIPRENIISVYTDSQNTSDKIKKTMAKVLSNRAVIPHPWMFFLPKFQKNISEKITLLKEDMFFSEMQTFTISVNTVGIMGKGLASRTKYQSPDVYVLYQDLCRQKKLRMGVPYLYKRSENFVRTLMEDVPSSVTENGHRWFLLFPTKNHWRERSPVAGIEKGLKWLVENYPAQGITSLALPALGCGLGGLSWQVVGPLMCKYLKQMNIQSEIYLPLEKDIPEEYLKPEFLFSKL